MEAYFMITPESGSLEGNHMVEQVAAKVHACHSHGPHPAFHVNEDLSFEELHFINENFELVYAAVIRRN